MSIKYFRLFNCMLISTERLNYKLKAFSKILGWLTIGVVVEILEGANFVIFKIQDSLLQYFLTGR